MGEYEVQKFKDVVCFSIKSAFDLVEKIQKDERKEDPLTLDGRIAVFDFKDFITDEYAK